jgi:tetratricopeptide (TPR) repeat protein
MASSKTLKTLFIRHLVVCREADRLIDLGEKAVAVRDSEKLAQVGAALSRMSEGGLSDAGAYFSALALNNSRASRAQAEAMLERVAVQATPLFRAKALLALGGNQIENGNPNAKEYYEAASKINPNNLLVTFSIRSMQAVLRSLAGDHRRALDGFESLKPLARSVGARIPFYGFNFINSLSYAHLKVGNLDQADGLIKVALDSPYQCPAFDETRDEIAAVRRRRAQRPIPNEAARKAAARRALHSLLIVPPKPDPFTATGLESLVREVRQGKFRY